MEFVSIKTSLVASQIIAHKTFVFLLERNISQEKAKKPFDSI
jgi:hypothetical protein